MILEAFFFWSKQEEEKKSSWTTVMIAIITLSIKFCAKPKVIIQQINKWRDSQKQASDEDAERTPRAAMGSASSEPGSQGWDGSSAPSWLAD